MPPFSKDYSSQVSLDAHDLNIIKSTVIDVVKTSEVWTNRNMHEPGVSDLLINPFLHLPRRLKKYDSLLEVLNM